MTIAESEAIAFVFELEQGWYRGNEARDPNPTMDGVTQNTYNRWRAARGLPTRTVREMDVEERLAIYREFWRDCRGDAMHPGVAAIHFAYAFNAGPSAAARPLQRALGVRADGVIGPKTMAAISASSPDVLIPALLLEQVTSYHAMAIAQKHLRPNMTSWMGRIAAGWRRYGPRAARVA